MSIHSTESAGSPVSGSVLDRDFSEIIRSRPEPEYEAAYPNYRLVDANDFRGDFNPALWHLRFYTGAARAMTALANVHLGLVPPSWPEPARMIRTAQGNDRVVLFTARNEEAASVSLEEPRSMILAPGLGELDIATHLGLHKGLARKFPARDIYSLMNPGLCLNGAQLVSGESHQRPLTDTAEENLSIAWDLIGDEPTKLVGTSLGSVIATHAAEANLAANSHRQLNVKGVALLSPAVGIKNIDWQELDAVPRTDAADLRLIAKTRREFYTHMLFEEGFRVAVEQGEAAGECMVAGMAYLLEYSKLLPRLLTIRGNLKGVEAGVEYESFKRISQAYPVHALGGKECPILKATRMQYLLMSQIAPKTMLWEVEGTGHGMTANHAATASTLALMEQASSWA